MKLSKPVKILLTILPLILGLAVFVLPINSLAAGINNPMNTSQLNSVENIVNFILKVVIIIGGVVVFILFAVAGIIYLTGAGNEEQTGKAKKMMIDAAIGFVIVVAAWAIGKYIVKLVAGKNITDISNVTF